MGCIPKKLMHEGALMGEAFEEAKAYGWQVEKPKHDWSSLVDNVQDYIASLNFGTLLFLSISV